MGPKRRRQVPAPVVPRGPNHQLNVLREALDAQIKAEATLETTQDAGIQEALENDISNRNSLIADTLCDFLYDPFNRQPLSNFSNAQKYALRRLRTAMVNELDQPSDKNKAVLRRANQQLLFVMRSKTKRKQNIQQWVPAKYLDPSTKSECTYLTVKLSQANSYVYRWP